MLNLLMQATEAAGEAAQNTAQQPQGSGLLGFLPFILMIAILYFLMIRPQQKKQKEHQKMINELSVHDEVITNGGIIGKIVNIKKDKNILVIRVDESTNTKIEVQKGSIAGVMDEKKKNKKVESKTS